MNPNVSFRRKYTMRSRSVLCLILPGLLSSTGLAQATSGVSATATLRYLALGDSFTIGTGATPAESFPAKLAEAMRAAGQPVELKNLGVNGYTTDMLIERELTEVVGFKPNLVTLAIGANDIVHRESKETYRKQVRRILKALLNARMAGKQIIAVPQPDWSLSPAAASFGEPASFAAQIASFNDILKEETLAIGGRYVDLFPLMQQEARAHLVAPDGLHPSKKAYAEWVGPLMLELKRGGEIRN